MTEEATETECTEMFTCPVGVKPNFSKRIMARASLVIDRVLISAVERERRERRERRTRGRRRCGGLFILRGGCWFGGGGGGGGGGRGRGGGGKT